MGGLDAVPYQSLQAVPSETPAAKTIDGGSVEDPTQEGHLKSF
jgi:hypothetical protein